MACTRWWPNNWVKSSRAGRCLCSATGGIGSSRFCAGVESKCVLDIDI